MANYTAIAKPKAHFDVQTYAGSSSAKTITGVGFKPDLVWTKDRTEAHSWGCYDSTRGIKKWLRLDAVTSVNNNSDSGTIDASLTAFTSDGFTIATMSSDPIGNKNGNQFATWMWKANGGTTSSNSDGSITSTVQANATAGFSIVTYTGTGSAGTIGHGLGVAPKMILIKAMNNNSSWAVGHFDTGITSDPATDHYRLDTTSGSMDSNQYWNDTMPTSSVFSVGPDTTNGEANYNTWTYVAYCFAEVRGFSSIGTYHGVADNANGPFIYTGFRPSMVIIKRTDGTENWQLADIARAKIEKDGTQGTQGNTTECKLLINATTAENSTSGDIDLYSTGFKPRDTDGIHNWTDYKYIYYAVAENSIVGSNGTVGLAY